MPLLYQHNVDIFIPICLSAGSRKQEGVDQHPHHRARRCGHADPGEENLESYLEIDRLGGDRSNLFVLWVKGDLVSDLRERQLWRTPEWPPGSVRLWGHAYERRNSGWEPSRASYSSTALSSAASC